MLATIFKLTQPAASVNPSGAGARSAACDHVRSLGSTRDRKWIAGSRFGICRFDDDAACSSALCPVFRKEMAKSHQPVRLGARPKLVAALCMSQGRLWDCRRRGNAEHSSRLCSYASTRRAQQAQIALAPAASIGPRLLGAAGRATHVIAEIGCIRHSGSCQCSVSAWSGTVVIANCHAHNFAIRRLINDTEHEPDTRDDQTSSR